MTGSVSPPLRRWRVRSFKPIADVDLELAPLTVLVGPNSSGKSSLIQSILLAAQAAASHDRDGIVALNGPLVQLGELAKLRHAGDRRSDGVVLGATVAADGRRSAGGGAIEWEVELVAAARRRGGGDARVRRVHLAGPTERGGRVELVADRRSRRPVEPAGGHARRTAVQLAGRLSWAEPGGDEGSVRTAALLLRGGIPETVLIRSERTAVAVEQWNRRLQRAFDERRRPQAGATAATAAPNARGLAERAAARLAGLIASAIRDAGGEPPAGAGAARAFAAFDELRCDAAARGYWEELVRLVAARRIAGAVIEAVGPGGAVGVPAEEVEETIEPARQLQAASASLASLLATRVLHLGALRQDPQVLHRMEPSGRAGDVGRKGEYAIAVLHRQGDREVLCPCADGSLRPLGLREAVEHWMAAMGLLDGIATRDRAQLGVEARLAAPDGPAGLGLTAVGVGVSQVLPVLVMALAAQPGSVLLLEQPELHLHPAVQQRLGDFLLACSASGRQVLVETHSDHLVGRLRRRIAEDPDDRLVAEVRLVLCERRDGAARFRPLATNRYGGLDDWPVGFFDEGAADSRELLRAGLRKRGEP